MSRKEQKEPKEQKEKEPLTVCEAVEDDDEPDEWDKRILQTGCAAQNEKLTDCYFEKKDWRACTSEMAAFQQCWKKNQNDERTEVKDADGKN